MPLLTYCIVAQPAPASAEPIAGRFVQLVTVGALAAAVSELDAAPPATPEEALAFEEIVEWFHARCRSVIPVRFGSLFAHAAELHVALTARACEYARLLEELEDAVEFGVRLRTDPAPESGVASTGTAWLEARRRHYAGLDSLAGRWRASLAGLYRGVRMERGTDSLALSFLVPRRHAAEFQRRAGPSSSGPWPPYNFVNTGNLHDSLR